MPPLGFEITISAGERPQTYALDRAATGTGLQVKWRQTFKSDSPEHVVSNKLRQIPLKFAAIEG